MTIIQAEVSGKPSAAPTITGYNLTMDIDRQFEHVAYKPTQSVVDYAEKYDYTQTDSSGVKIDEEEVDTVNYGALSVWHQIDNKPEFLCAYKAMVHLRYQLFNTTNIYERYFSRNLQDFIVNDKDKTSQALLYEFTDATVIKELYDDPDYGLFNNLYKWVVAYNKDNIDVIEG
jgi:uncharacterized protein (DUF1330 family)